MTWEPTWTPLGLPLVGSWSQLVILAVALYLIRLKKYLDAGLRAGLTELLALVRANAAHGRLTDAAKHETVRAVVGIEHKIDVKTEEIISAVKDTAPAVLVEQPARGPEARATDPPGAGHEGWG